MHRLYNQDGSEKSPLLVTFPVDGESGTHIAVVAWALPGGRKGRGGLRLSATPFVDGSVPAANATLLTLAVSDDLGGADVAVSLAPVQLTGGVGQGEPPMLLLAAPSGAFALYAVGAAVSAGQGAGGALPGTAAAPALSLLANGSLAGFPSNDTLLAASPLCTTSATRCYAALLVQGATAGSLGPISTVNQTRVDVVTLPWANASIPPTVLQVRRVLNVCMCVCVCVCVSFFPLLVQLDLR
jgi:hypothetical protein